MTDSVHAVIQAGNVAVPREHANWPTTYRFGYVIGRDHAEIGDRPPAQFFACDGSHAAYDAGYRAGKRQREGERG